MGTVLTTPRLAPEHSGCMKPLHDLVGATRKEEPSKALLSMSEFHLPIGVVLPTLNVRAALPEHLEQMRS